MVVIRNVAANKLEACHFSIFGAPELIAQRDPSRAK